MIRDEAKRLGLKAQDAFWLTDDETLSQITGGCGPGSLGDHGWFDTILWLNIKPACRIHDFDYAVGGTQKDKDMCDLRFLFNMLRIVDDQSKFVLFKLYRRYRVMDYYNLVAEGGGKSFKEV